MLDERVVISEELTKFLTFMRELEATYTETDANVNREDKISSDLLHLLELGNLKCKERSKVATQLTYNRKNRRYYKDRKEELQALYDFYVHNRKFFHELDEVLGATRKQERAHKNREYKPRVVDITALL